ncbi:L-histidine N(alpha)-methyltransferase [Gordonia sp. DT30]|uniref:L-histidine N(alpha)-methyltransferase n=1 Tax=unclassified Gordonia (in: high G+C Gram-positive bacteria) TaxID=2657482 RepID=UPI003CF96A5D
MTVGAPSGTRSGAAHGLAADALAGLWSAPPVLPTKWLYDERGSRLFDEITRLPEYYPTRRETAILRAHADDVVARTGASMMIEFGSGTSTKTRLLLDAFAAAGRRFTYVPLDVSAEILAESSAILTRDYPGIGVAPAAGDFTDPDLTLPDSDGPRVAVFLGGTIGNFTDADRRRFFAVLAGALAPGDFLLLGADLIKDTGRLVAAYNDKAGVTADFNRNMIEVLRTGLDATGLYVDDFDHLARWNPVRHRIEMWLRARRDVDAYFGVLQREWTLAAGAEIRTEISTKFELPVLGAELDDAGLRPVTSWTDPFGDFSLTLTRR